MQIVKMYKQLRYLRDNFKKIPIKTVKFIIDDVLLMLDISKKQEKNKKERYLYKKQLEKGILTQKEDDAYKEFEDYINKKS